MVQHDGRTGMTEAKKSKGPRGKVFINIEMCKGCGFCIEFCPSNVLGFSDTYNAKGYHPPAAVRSEDCTGCDLCGVYCPDFAIFGIINKTAA